MTAPITYPPATAWVNVRIREATYARIVRTLEIPSTSVNNAADYLICRSLAKYETDTQTKTGE